MLQNLLAYCRLAISFNRTSLMSLQCRASRFSQANANLSVPTSLHLRIEP